LASLVCLFHYDKTCTCVFHCSRCPFAVTDADYLEFDEFLKQSDFVIVTAAFTPETKEIFNERAFSLMKSTAVFVNTSRGGRSHFFHAKSRAFTEIRNKYLYLPIFTDSLLTAHRVSQSGRSGSRTEGRPYFLSWA
jgi:hypothetical protein